LLEPGAVDVLAQLVDSVEAIIPVVLIGQGTSGKQVLRTQEKCLSRRTRIPAVSVSGARPAVVL
jgi:hypothetical protein